MALSKKIQGFITQSSWIRKMFEAGIQLKEQYGAENVFDFSLGNPNVPPPDRFQQVLRETAADDRPGVHAYMPNAGLSETRSAIARHLSHIHEMPITTDHIITTCGAGGALNVVFKTLLDPDDEVIIPTPFFVEYRFYIDNHDGIPVLVSTNDDFSLDIAAVEKAITDKTKIVLINSPNNPTGAVYDADQIDALSRLLSDKSAALGREIYLVSDEPYRDIVYDGMIVPSVLSRYQNSIIATSYSKSLSIPGERIGYIALNPALSDRGAVTAGMVLCNRILGFVNAPALMQRVVARLQGVSVESTVYQKKRDLLYAGLTDIGYDVEKPVGAFYLFPRTPIDDDVAFVQVLQKYNILAVPGSGFGGPGHIRLSYCVDDTTITGAMSGFERAFHEFR